MSLMFVGKEEFKYWFFSIWQIHQIAIQPYLQN